MGALSAQYEALSVEASKQTSSEEIVSCIADKLNLNDGTGGPYELAEVCLIVYCCIVNDTSVCTHTCAIYYVTL